MQHCFYHRQIHIVDELNQLLIDVWCDLEQSIFDETIDQWRGRYPACVHAKGWHFGVQPVNWQCWFCDVFDCYIFNYEIMPATLANTFLFILQGSALADLRYGGRFMVHVVIVNFCPQRWKNYWNRTVFAKVMLKWKRVQYLTHSIVVTTSNPEETGGVSWNMGCYDIPNVSCALFLLAE